MIRMAPQPEPAAPVWHTAFLAMVPAIVTQARFAYRGLKPEAREDAIEEVIANALVAFVRLVQLNKVELAYPSALARYAIAQLHDGRRVGNRLNVRDVLSPYAQKQKDFQVERLDRFDQNDHAWVAAVVEDGRTPVPDQVAFRCDFPAWLDTLPGRNRRIAEILALNHTTGKVAEEFHVSAGRISQLRRDLQRSWQEFQGEVSSDEPDADAA